MNYKKLRVVHEEDTPKTEKVGHDNPSFNHEEAHTNKGYIKGPQEKRKAPAPPSLPKKWREFT